MIKKIKELYHKCDVDSTKIWGNYYFFRPMFGLAMIITLLLVMLIVLALGWETSAYYSCSEQVYSCEFDDGTVLLGGETLGDKPPVLLSWLPFIILIVFLLLFAINHFKFNRGNK